MATFTNTITNVGTLYQAENMTFGGPVTSASDLQAQLADLETLLHSTPDLPAPVQQATADALKEAKTVPASEPGAAAKIVSKLEVAKGFLVAATEVSKQVGPLIGAIGAVVATATGLVR